MTNVLIIDDEENLRRLLARVIELEGYVTFQASSTKDGLKGAQKENIQVIVSDVKLPDGNGIDFTAKIKKNFLPFTPHQRNRFPGLRC